MLLAGDLGGTKTLLAFYPLKGPARPQKLKQYPTRQFRSPTALIKTYLAETGARPKRVSLAVAGPVLRGRVDMVNVGWRFSASALARALAVDEVFLLNDLEALAYAVPHLDKKYLYPLKPGRRDPQGNVAVLAAGTGLGRSFLIKRHLSSPVPVATEGGHVDFAPWDELTWELYQFLARRFGHVSVERVVSGPGLENIYEFLCQREGVTPRFSSAKEIGPAGLSGEDPLARKALEIFIYAYGKEAGNWALSCLATGGVMLGGGIAPKLLPLIAEKPFQEGFLAKGRFRDFLARIPVFLIKHPYPVLYGAALFGRSYPYSG